MTQRRRLAIAAVLSGFAIAVTPAVAAALAITVPASVNVGGAPAGAGTLFGHLGTVTVTASGLVARSFTATVSSRQLHDR